MSSPNTPDDREIDKFLSKAEQEEAAWREMEAEEAECGELMSEEQENELVVEQILMQIDVCVKSDKLHSAYALLQHLQDSGYPDALGEFDNIRRDIAARLSITEQRPN